MNDSLDVLSGLAVGAFLLMVVVKGNSSALVQQAVADKAFLKWAIALGILFYLQSVSGLSEPVSLLIAAAFVGLFLTAGSTIIPQVTAFWKSFGANP